ncbi:MAG TPA: CARDB domain-containing protein, partial [Candidatus Thermoplasmatota archaeon]|nr:CARDB domain-containing protein [Candidatus Thermoplasmatota archaeon]
MKRSLAFLTLALVLAASVAVPLAYTYFTATEDSQGGAGEDRAAGLGAAGNGPLGADPLAPGRGSLGGTPGTGEAGLHNTTPRDLNRTPYVPIWDLPADRVPPPVGAIARYEREEAERTQNETRGSANSNFSRIRDLLAPVDVETRALLLNDTVENATSAALKWRTYRLLQVPIRGGFTLVENPEQSLWHVEPKGYRDSKGAWVAGLGPLGNQQPRMNDVLESPPIDLSGVLGASGDTPQGVKREPIPSSTVEPIVDAVIPAGTRVPERQYAYGAGLVNVSYWHRYNFGLAGEDGALVEISTLWRNNGTWSPWKPLHHSEADQLAGRQYTMGESLTERVSPTDPKFSSIPVLGTPGYTYTSSSMEDNWTYDEFDLSNYVGETIKLRLRVGTRDLGFDTANTQEFPERDFFGWWVDNLTLRATVRPIDAALSAVLSPKPGDVLVPGDTINVTALVSNVGGSALHSLRVRLAVNDTLEAEKQISLNPQESRLVTIPWRVPEGVHRLNVSVLATVGTANVFLPAGDPNRANDYFEFNVAGARVNDAELVIGSLSATPALAEDGTPREIRAVLENVGNLPLENLTLTLNLTDARTGLPAPGRIQLARVGNETRTGGASVTVSDLPAGKRITSLGSDQGRLEVAWAWTPPTPGIYNATVRLTGGNGRDADASNNLLPRFGERFQIRVRATPASYLGPVTFENETDPALAITRAGPTDLNAWRAAVPNAPDPGEGTQLLQSSQNGAGRTPDRVAATAGIALPAVSAGEKLLLTVLTREDGMIVNAPGAASRDEGRIELYVSSDPRSASVSPGDVLRDLRSGSGPGGSRSHVTLHVAENEGRIGWQSRTFNLTPYAGRTVFLVFNHSVPAEPGNPNANVATTWGIDGYRIDRVPATGASSRVWPAAPAAGRGDNGCSVVTAPGPTGTRVFSSDHFPLFAEWSCITTSLPAQWRTQGEFDGPGAFNERTLQWVPGQREYLVSPVVSLKNASDPWLTFDHFLDLTPEPFRVLFGGRVPYTPFTGDPASTVLLRARAAVEIQAFNETRGAWDGWTKIYPEKGYNAGNFGPTSCIGAPFDDEANGPYDDFLQSNDARDDNSFQGLNGPWKRVGFNLTNQPKFTPVNEQGLCPKEPERVSYAGKLVRFRFGVTGGPVASTPVLFPGAKGWFLDNIAVRERYFANDVGLALETVGTAEPVRVGNGGIEVGQGSSLIVSAKVRNYGRYDQQNVPVLMQVRLHPEDDRGPGDPLHNYSTTQQVALVSRLRGLAGETDYTTVNFSIPWTVPACGAPCEGRRFEVHVSTSLERTPGKRIADDDPSNGLAVLNVVTRTVRDLSVARADLTPAIAEAEAERALAFTVANTGNVDAFDPEGRLRANLVVARVGGGIVLTKSLPLANVNKIAFGRATSGVFLLTAEETRSFPDGVYTATLRVENPGDMRPANNEAVLLFRIVRLAEAWTFGEGDRSSWVSGSGWVLTRGAGGDGTVQFREDPAGRASEALLESPVIPLSQVSRAIVKLTHNFSFEQGFDGGRLEARAGNNRTGEWGPWVALTPEGGYPGTIGSGTPLGPTTGAGFTGASADAATGRWTNATFEVAGKDIETRAVLFEDTLERVSRLRVNVTRADGLPLTGVTVTLVDLGRSLSGADVTFTKLPGGRMNLLVTAPGMKPLARTVDLPVDSGSARFLPLLLEPCAGACPAAPAPEPLTGWRVVNEPRMANPPTGIAYYSGPNAETTMSASLSVATLNATGTLLRFRDWREIEFVGVGPVSAAGNGEDFNDRALVQVTYRDAACVERTVTLERVSANTSTRYEDFYDRSWPQREADLKPYLDEQMRCGTQAAREQPLGLAFRFEATQQGMAINTGWAVTDIHVGARALTPATGLNVGTWAAVTKIDQGTRWNFYPAEDRDILGTSQAKREGAFAFTLDSQVPLKGDSYVQVGYLGRNAEGVLESPPLDLSALVGEATLVLNHKYQFDNVAGFITNGGRVEVRYVDLLGVEHIRPLTPLGGYDSTLFGTSYSARNGTLGFSVNATEGLFSGGEAGSMAVPGNEEGWVTHRFDLTPYKGLNKVQLRFHAFVGGNPNLFPELERRMSWVIGGLRVEGAALEATDLQLRLRALTDATGGASRWDVDEVRILTETFRDETSVLLDPYLDGSSLRSGTLPATPHAASREDAVGFELVNRGGARATVRAVLDVTYADGTNAQTLTKDVSLAPGERKLDAFSWRPPTPKSGIPTNVTLRLRAFPLLPGLDADESAFRLGDQLGANNDRRATLRLSPTAVLSAEIGEVSAPATGIPDRVPDVLPIRVAAKLTGTSSVVANVSIVITNGTYRHEAFAQAPLRWPKGEGFATYAWELPEDAVGVYRVYANLTSPDASNDKGRSVGRVFVRVPSVAFADDFEPSNGVEGGWSAQGWVLTSISDAHSGKFVWRSLRATPGAISEVNRLTRGNLDLAGIPTPTLTLSARYAYPEGTRTEGARFEIREAVGDPNRPWQPLTLDVPYTVRFPGAPDAAFQGLTNAGLLTGRTTGWATLSADLTKQVDLLGRPVSYAGKLVEIRLLNVLGSSLPEGTWGIEVDDFRIGSNGLALTPGVQELTVRDGVTKEFQFRVTNTGAVSDLVNVSVEGAGIPNEWVYGLCETTCASRVTKLQVALAPGESYTGTVRVEMGLSPFPSISTPILTVKALSQGDPNRLLTAPIQFKLMAGRHADLLVAEVVPGKTEVTLGEAVPVAVFIRNQGTAAVDGGRVSVRLFDNGRPLDTLVLPVAVLPDPFSLREKWAVASFVWRPVDTGLHQLVAVVNPDNRVEELSFGNNEFLVPLIDVSAAPEPDLSVASVGLTPEAPLTGTVAEVTVILRNRGNVEAGNVRLEARAGSFLVGLAEGIVLGPGEARQLVFPWRVIAGAEKIT